MYERIVEELRKAVDNKPLVPKRGESGYIIINELKEKDFDLDFKDGKYVGYMTFPCLLVYDKDGVKMSYHRIQLKKDGVGAKFFSLWGFSKYRTPFGFVIDFKGNHHTVYECEDVILTAKKHLERLKKKDEAVVKGFVIERDVEW